MKIKAVVHQAEEGGFWAEVPAIPGWGTQAETMEELLRKLHEAIEGCLSAASSSTGIYATFCARQVACSCDKERQP